MRRATSTCTRPRPTAHAAATVALMYSPCGPGDGIRGEKRRERRSSGCECERRADRDRHDGQEPREVAVALGPQDVDGGEHDDGRDDGRAHRCPDLDTDTLGGSAAVEQPRLQAGVYRDRERGGGGRDQRDPMVGPGIRAGVARGARPGHPAEVQDDVVCCR
jgi:hypothetical protein